MRDRVVGIYGKFKKHPLAPAILLALVALAVFFTTLVVKHRTFYVFPDNIDQFYAWYQKLAYAVHRGTLPIWDANTSAGHSFVGELQAGVFYPVNLVWVLLFGSKSGISIFFLEAIVVFHFWLASLGAYYAARSLGLSRYASGAAGLTYAYGGSVAVRSVSQTAIFFGLCLIPWVFFMFNRYLKTRKIKFLILTAVFEGLIILAGHIQPWFHANLLLLFFVCFHSFSPSFKSVFRVLRSRLGALVVAALLSLIVALPQVLLSAQYLPHAYRFVGDPSPITASQKVSIGTFTKTYSFKPQDFLSLVNPVQYPVIDGGELYVGITGLAVIMFIFVFCKKQLKEHVVWNFNKRFLIFSSAITAVIMLGFWTFIPAVLRLLPLFSQIRQLARYSIIVHFCLMILVGIAIEVCVRKYDSRDTSLRGVAKQRAIHLVVLSFLVLNTIYLYGVSRNHHGYIDKHFVYQNAILTLAVAAIFVGGKYIRQILLFAVVLSSIVSPVWFLPKINNFPSTYAPNYYKRTKSITFLEGYYGKARVIVEDNALPVNIGNVYDIQTINGYGATLHIPFYDYLNEPDPKDNSGIHMDLLNAEFIVSKKAHPELTLKLYDEERDIYIYERPGFLPRAYFESKIDVCRQHSEQCAGSEVVEYNNSYAKIETNSSQPEKLILSEVTFDGWKAYVDGEAVDIEDYGPYKVKLLRSVDLSAGKHSVEFKYQPLAL